MTLTLSLVTFLLIEKGISEETQSERYVMIESTSSSQLRLKVCASNDNIETCGTWSYLSSYNCTSHFYVRSVNKDNDLQGKYTSLVHKISTNHAVCKCLQFLQICNPFFKLGTTTNATATLRVQLLG